VDKYIFEDDPEKTLDEIFKSKMIGKEVKYIIVKNDEENEEKKSVLEREFNVIFWNFFVIY
jgi:hypothetical protein